MAPALVAEGAGKFDPPRVSGLCSVLRCLEPKSGSGLVT